MFSLSFIQIIPNHQTNDSINRRILVKTGKIFQQMLNQHWVYPVHSTLYLGLDICGRKDARFIT
ncbi:hypothetical protein DMI60_13375 [Escherichia coli]|nr:hypothetical protein [Escherichia coli]